jgi:sugar lactone lactonase YvrE
MQTLSEIEELFRVPSPAPANQALAVDGTTLWMGSLETQRIYGVDSRQGRVFEENPAPGRPIGMCVTGDELRVVCSENGKEDNRFIRRYIFGHGFKEKEKIACPDDTGSFVAFDGDLLYLSQRFNKRILVIDEKGHILRVVAELPREITGMTIFGGCFYLATSSGVDSGDYRITKVDARKPGPPEIVDLATVPFEARSLCHDGQRFWTNQRWEKQFVAFRIPA